MQEALQQQEHQHAHKPEIDQEAAAWARGRSQTRAIIELYSEMLALKELVRSLQEMIPNGSN